MNSWSSSVSIHSCGSRYYTTPQWFRCFPLRAQTINQSIPIYRRHTDPISRQRNNLVPPNPRLTYKPPSSAYIWTYLFFESDLVDQDPDVGILTIGLLPISSRIPYLPWTGRPTVALYPAFSLLFTSLVSALSRILTVRPSQPNFSTIPSYLRAYPLHPSLIPSHSFYTFPA